MVSLGTLRLPDPMQVLASRQMVHDMVLRSGVAHLFRDPVAINAKVFDDSWALRSARDNTSDLGFPRIRDLKTASTITSQRPRNA
jgi:hypothetical protein